MIATITDIRVRIAAVALAAMVALCALAAPTRAYAKLASEDDWQQNVDSREEGDPDGDSWDDYELGGEHKPGFNPLNPMPLVTYTVYSWLEGMAGTLTNVSNDVWGALDSVGTLDSDYAPSADSPYRSIYNVATRVQRDVVNKVALGFLGIFLALSLLEFARETGTSPRYGIAQFSGFLWICAKFAVMIQLINHLDMLCGAIFNVFAWVARQTGSVISGLLPADAETFGGFMISMQKTTYSQAGVAFVYVLLALVIVAIVFITLVRVISISVIRLIEVYLMSAFAGFPLVLATTKRTRDSAIRYFKSYAGACLQAAVLLVLIACSGLVMAACTAIFTAGDLEGVSGAVVGAIAPVAGCLAIQAMVGQSRQFADRIMGA